MPVFSTCETLKIKVRDLLKQFKKDGKTSTGNKENKVTCCVICV